MVAIKLLVQKFGPLKKCWVKKQKLSLKMFGPQKSGPKSLVKIRPVTAEILQIWTKAARA